MREYIVSTKGINGAAHLVDVTSLKNIQTDSHIYSYPIMVNGVKCNNPNDVSIIVRRYANDDIGYRETGVRKCPDCGGHYSTNGFSHTIDCSMAMYDTNMVVDCALWDGSIDECEQAQFMVTPSDTYIAEMRKRVEREAIERANRDIAREHEAEFYQSQSKDSKERMRKEQVRILKSHPGKIDLSKISPYPDCKIDPDECPEHGEGHKFELDSIPRQYIDGIEDGTVRYVIQCEYCGMQKPGTETAKSPTKKYINLKEMTKTDVNSNTRSGGTKINWVWAGIVAWCLLATFTSLSFAIHVIGGLIDNA